MGMKIININNERISLILYSKQKNKKTKIRTQNAWDQKYKHIFIIIEIIYKHKINKAMM